MIEVGKKMHWRKVVSNYGHEHVIPVTVVRIGKKITVEATNKWGSTVRLVVTPERLHEIKE